MNRSSFDWHLLPSFIALLDHLTLVKAAKQLGLSQPTLGRHLLELEEQLGVVLFERTGLPRHEDAVLRHLKRGDHVGDDEDSKRIAHLLRMPHVPVARRHEPARKSAQSVTVPCTPL